MAQTDLAGASDLGSIAPIQLFAGEQDIVTDRAKVKAGLVFAKYEVFAFDAAGLIVKHAPASGTITAKAGGIMAQALDTSGTGTNADTFCPYYSGGFFNEAALVWEASLDTLAERRQAFAGTNISIGRLL